MRDMKKALMKINTFFLINDELRKQYNEILDKVNNNIKKGFDSETVYNEKYLKTKIKSYLK